MFFILKLILRCLNIFYSRRARFLNRKINLKEFKINLNKFLISIDLNVKDPFKNRSDYFRI